VGLEAPQPGSFVESTLPSSVRHEVASVHVDSPLRERRVSAPTAVTLSRTDVRSPSGVRVFATYAP
jgi:hypothetical protein